MSRQRDKGTAAETAVVAYLRDRGFLHAERRALRGADDRGDITGLPGVSIEVKNHARTELALWLDETERQRRGDHVAVVWHKRRGKGRAADWFVTMTGEQFVDLLREAGL